MMQNAHLTKEFTEEGIVAAAQNMLLRVNEMQCDLRDREGIE